MPFIRTRKGFGANRARFLTKITIVRLCAAVLVSASVWLGDVPTLGAQGDVWRAVGPEGGFVYTIAIDPRTPATLYAGLYINDTGDGHGVFKSTDSGSSWSAVNTGLPYPHPISALVIDPLTSTALYAGWNYVYRGMVFRRTGGDDDWRAASKGISGNVLALAINPQIPATLYAGTTGEPPLGGVFKSTNRGVNWTEISHSLPNRNFSTLAIDPHTPETVYAGTGGGGIFKSTDGGANWSDRKLGLLIVYALAIDPNVPTTLYAGTRTHGDGFPGGGVYKSTDGGDSWTLTNNGLPDTPAVTSLVVDPQAPMTLYAAVHGVGVFRSIDGAASWTDISGGLTNPYIRALAIDSETPANLYAGTYGNGIFAITPH